MINTKGVTNVILWTKNHKAVKDCDILSQRVAFSMLLYCLLELAHMAILGLC